MQKLTCDEIEYYIDEESKRLAEAYNPGSVNNSCDLTGNFVETCGLMPFLLTAFSTNKFYGFNLDGYKEVIKYFGFTHRRAMDYAKASASEEGLERLAARGYLRTAEYEYEKVYFVSEEIIRRAIGQ